MSKWISAIFEAMAKLICCFLLFLLPYSLSAQSETPYVIVLGIAQDGGYPHMGCAKQCCNKAWKDRSVARNVVTLAVADPKTGKWWLFEATPDIKEQLHLFQELTGSKFSYLPAGIFVTHAHIGHYTGLMQLGREVMGTSGVPVYAMPKMVDFLSNNGPWSQLVQLHNISLQTLHADSACILSPTVSVYPFAVPHRDEYSETAGFRITTPGKNYLFIPDINKWQQWDKHIVDEVSKVDIAFVDATFYDSTELPGRNIKEVPHPFVSETMQLFAAQPVSAKKKVCFIHFNHTNPLLWDERKKEEVKQSGFSLAVQGQRY